MSRTKPINGRGRGRTPEEPATPIPVPSAAIGAMDAETGRDAFRRIAEGRVKSILAKLNVLAKMSSGKSKYGYTDGDIEYIRETLVKAVNASCDRLMRKPVKEGFSFERGRDASA